MEQICTNAMMTVEIALRQKTLDQEEFRLSYVGSRHCSPVLRTFTVFSYTNTEPYESLATYWLRQFAKNTKSARNRSIISRRRLGYVEWLAGSAS